MAREEFTDTELEAARVSLIEAKEETLKRRKQRFNTLENIMKVGWGIFLASAVFAPFFMPAIIGVMIGLGIIGGMGVWKYEIKAVGENSIGHMERDIRILELMGADKLRENEAVRGEAKRIKARTDGPKQ